LHSGWITLPVLIHASVHDPILALTPVRALNHYLVLDPNFALAPVRVLDHFLALYPTSCLAPVTSPPIFSLHTQEPHSRRQSTPTQTSTNRPPISAHTCKRLQAAYKILARVVDPISHILGQGKGHGKRNTLFILLPQPQYIKHFRSSPVAVGFGSHFQFLSCGFFVSP